MGLSMVGGGGAPPPSLADQVEAILAGTTGFALDPSDTSRMWQDTGTATPVTTLADPVGHIRSKWGTTTYDFTQPTAASRPAWHGVAGLTYDGSADTIADLNPYTFLNNVPAAFVSLAVNITSVAANRQIFHFPTPTAANHRFSLAVLTDRSFAQAIRRLDADALNNPGSSASIVPVATKTILTSQVDYASTGASEAWCDGVSRITSTIGGSVANTSATDGNNALLGAHSSGAFLLGSSGRLVFTPFIPSAGQRATIEAWVNEVAL